VTRRRPLTVGPPPDTSTGAAGSATLELVVLTPALLALLLMMVAAGRVTATHGQVDGAARDAARAASLQRSAPAARTAARDTAASSLASQRLTCRPMTVRLTGSFAAAAGTPAAVTVRVGCTVALGDVGLPGLPGAKTLSADYTAVLDTYRGRAP
jgi:Flp pilus assembly protein TadG